MAKTPKTVYEVLEKVAEAKTREEKVAVLLDNNTLALRDILRGSFDDSIQWNLPPGKPPYEEDSKQWEEGEIQRRTKNLRYFVKGGEGDRLKPMKREKMFIDILETVHPKDAELLILMKDKKLAGVYKGLTKKLVQTAWPNLIVS